jgi:flagellar biosynthesis/type III secretory pathway protein FliH
MMNSSSSPAPGSAFAVPVTTFMYRDTRDAASAHERDHGGEEDDAPVTEKAVVAHGPSPQDIADMVNRARAEAAEETEDRLKQHFEARAEAQMLSIRAALEKFAAERKTYFSKVEAELVQLSLAIAAKILHREAQVDPLLVAALVRVAVEKLHDGSSVTVRVAPRETAKWREALANPAHGSTIKIAEDMQLGPADCVLETDLGSANFGLDAQLKEVEQGFFDLLALRPEAK